MRGIDTCTIVLEFNYRKNKETQGSVWISAGDRSLDIAQDKPLDGLGFIKVAGPINYEEAASIHSNMKMFFEQNGVAVVDEGVAD